MFTKVCCQQFIFVYSCYKFSKFISLFCSFCSDEGLDSRSGSNEEDVGERGVISTQSKGNNAASYHTPTKDHSLNSASSSVRSAHTAGYNKKRVNSMGFVKLQHFSESKRTSSFWKERLGKRDLTSVLSSPLSQKLF